MMHYKISELDNNQLSNLQKDNYTYIELKYYVRDFTLKLQHEELISKIILKCDTKVELLNLFLIFKKEFQNDLTQKQINIPHPYPQSKLGFGDMMVYQIFINENQKVNQIQIKLKDQSTNMRIYHIGIHKGEQQKGPNKVMSQQGDIRQFFDNVQSGKTIQRKDNQSSRSYEPYQNDYTNQSFGLKKSFSQLKSSIDIVDEFGDMSLHEKNLQKLALEKFQAEKNKQAIKPQEKQQPQRYEQKILITKKDTDIQKNKQIQQQEDEDDLFKNRGHYAGHIQTYFGTERGRYEQQKKQEQNIKQVQNDLGYNNPQKQQQKRNYPKEGNKSKPENGKELNSSKKIDIFDSDLMTTYAFDQLSVNFRQNLRNKEIHLGGEKAVQNCLYLINKSQQIHDRKWDAINNGQDYQNQDQ